MTAFWIAHVTITDPAAYADYLAIAPEAIAAYGGVFLARGGESEVLEGPELERHVVISFPSLAAAKACYTSPAYERAKAARKNAAIAHVTIVEGLPQ
jgi:uncharacterized protein (DUF1330 family)